MSTKSEDLRKRGNQAYLKVTENVAPAICKLRLEEALKLYHDAMATAVSDKDRSSAAKNIGMASCKMALFLETQDDEANTMNRVLFYRMEVIKYFQAALRYGETNRSRKWSDYLKKVASNTTKEILDYLFTLKFEEREKELWKLSGIVLPHDSAQVFHELAETLFHHAVTNQQAGDFRNCLRCLHECYFPIEEVKRLGSSGEKQAAIVLQNDVSTQMQVAESQKAVQTGEQLLEVITQGEEYLDIEMAWEIVDWFKQAILLTREKDMELEAIALSHLGHVFDKVLKMKQKARGYFHRSIQLALSMSPMRIFTDKEWFKVANKTLERYHKEEMTEEMAWQTERSKYVEQLKEDLEELNRISNKHPDTFEGAVVLMEFVYKKFPPKNPKFEAPTVTVSSSQSEIKKATQKAVTHYHPDRQSEHGKKWKVLCEEICKELTRRYEGMKGVE